MKHINRKLTFKYFWFYDEIENELSSPVLSVAFKSRMRVQTEEWRRFIPGVRMYKGKKTLFYNGEKLWDDENYEWLVYSEEERQTWEVIVVLPGVEVISENTFYGCKNVKVVIMAETVKRIEDSAFQCCESLVFVRLSTNLEYIARCAFAYCVSLPSIFIPPSCREICTSAFYGCRKLIIFNVTQHTALGRYVFAGTALIAASSFETNCFGHYENHVEVHNWIKNINQSEEYALHRACCSFNNSTIVDVIYQIVRREGLQAFQAPDGIGITPSQYLEANPFRAEDVQTKVINRFVLEMMG